MTLKETNQAGVESNTAATLLFDTTTDSTGKQRYARTASEIARRSFVGADNRGVLSESGFTGVWSQTRDHFLSSVAAEIFTKKAFDLLDFHGNKESKLVDVLSSFIQSKKQELDKIKNGNNKAAIVEAQKKIAREIREIVSCVNRDEDSYLPHAIQKSNSLNCVSAEYLGGHMMEQIGLTFLIAEVPGHSVHMLVTLEDGMVYFADMLAPEIIVKMDDSALEWIGSAQLVDLAISSGNQVITFEIKSKELDKLKNTLLKRQGMQFVCRAYDFKIGYFLQSLFNLSLKFNKPEWVLDFNELGMSLSSDYVPLAVRAARANNRLDNTKDAESLFLSAIEKEPHVSSHYLDLAAHYKRTNKLDQALELLSKAEELSPKYALIPLQLGRILETQGRLDLAEQKYLVAMKTDKKAADPRISLIKLYLRTNQKEKAKEILQRSVSANLYSSSALIEMAELAEEIDVDLAKKAYERSYSKKSGAFEALRYAQFLHRIGSKDESLVVFEDSEKKYPDYIYLYLRHAELLVSLNKRKEAVEVLKSALLVKRLTYDELVTKYGLNIYTDMIEFDEIYEWVVPYSEKGWDLEMLTSRLMEMGEMKLYEQALVKCLELDPNNYIFLRSMGKLLHNKGDFVEAKNCYKKAISINTQDYVSRINLLILLIELNEGNEASILSTSIIDNYEKAENYLNSRSAMQIADGLLRIGETEAASQCYLKICNQNDIAYLISKIATKISNFNSELAKEVFEQVCLREKDPDLFVDFCNFLIDLKDTDEAILIVEKIINMDENIKYNHQFIQLIKRLEKLGFAELATRAYFKATASARYGTEIAKIAESVFLLGFSNEAMGIFDEALETKKNAEFSLEVLSLQFEFLLNHQFLDEIRPVVEKIINLLNVSHIDELESFDYAAVKLLGVAHYCEGNQQESFATQIYEKLEKLRLSNGSIDVAKKLAMIGRVDKADALFNRILSSEDPAINLGEVNFHYLEFLLFENKNIELAKGICKNIYELDEPFAEFRVGPKSFLKNRLNKLVSILVELKLFDFIEKICLKALPEASPVPAVEVAEILIENLKNINGLNSPAEVYLRVGLNLRKSQSIPQIAEKLIEIGEFEKAKTVFIRILEMDDASNLLIEKLAKFLFKHGFNKEGNKVTEIIRNSSLNDVNSIHNSLSEMKLLAIEGKQNEAFKIGKGILYENYSTSVFELLLKINEEYKVRGFHQLVVYLLEKYAENEVIVLEMSNLLKIYNSKKESLLAYEVMLNKNPDNQEISFIIGELSSELGFTKKARKFLEKCFIDQPTAKTFVLLLKNLDKDDSLLISMTEIIISDKRIKISEKEMLAKYLIASRQSNLGLMIIESIRSELRGFNDFIVLLERIGDIKQAIELQRSRMTSEYYRNDISNNCLLLHLLIKDGQSDEVSKTVRTILVTMTGGTFQADLILFDKVAELVEELRINGYQEQADELFSIVGSKRIQ